MGMRPSASTFSPSRTFRHEDLGKARSFDCGHLTTTMNVVGKTPSLVRPAYLPRLVEFKYSQEKRPVTNMSEKNLSPFPRSSS